jgi:hypothetical protein
MTIAMLLRNTGLACATQTGNALELAPLHKP